MVVPPIWGWGWFWVSTWTWTCWTASWVHGVVGGVGCFCLCCGERNWCMYGCSRVTRVRWWSPRLSEDPIPLCWLCAKIAMFTAPPSVQYQIAQFFRINNQRRVGSRDKSCSNALLYGTGAEVSGVFEAFSIQPKKKRSKYVRTDTTDHPTVPTTKRP